MSGQNGSHVRLDAILARAALTCPQRTPVIFQDITWTYGEVRDRAPARTFVPNILNEKPADYRKAEITILRFTLKRWPSCYRS